MSNYPEKTLASEYPDVASWCKNYEDALTHSPHSSDYIDWVCPYCKEDIPHKSISNIVKDGLSCPKCSDGISYPNKLMMHILVHIRDNYLPWLEIHPEYYPEWCSYPFNDEIHRGRYDFALTVAGIPLCIIEMNGLFHYEDNLLSGQLRIDSVWIDACKQTLAQEHGFKFYAIDCRKSELSYIKENIIHELHPFFVKYNINLSNDVDWKNCERRALKNIVNIVCNLYNDGLLPKEIILKTMLSPSAVYKYLNKGAKVGLCNYPDGREVAAKAQWTKDHFSKPVICFNDNKRFSGSKEAFEFYDNIKTYNQINGWASRKKRCTILHPNGKPYDFMYISDYEEFGYIPYKNYDKETGTIIREMPEHYTKPVICVTTNEIFDSIPDAAIFYKLDKKQLWYNCIGKCYSVGELNGDRLIWRFIEDYDEEENYEYESMFERHGGMKAYPVICLNTMEQFSSSSEASEKYGLNKDKINACAKGTTSHSGVIKKNKEPLVWRYLKDYNEKDPILLPKIHNKQVRYIIPSKMIILNLTKDLAQYFNIGSQNRSILSVMDNGHGFIKEIYVERLDYYFTEHPEIRNQIQFYREHVYLKHEQQPQPN